MGITNYIKCHGTIFIVMQFGYALENIKSGIVRNLVNLLEWASIIIVRFIRSTCVKNN